MEKAFGGFFCFCFQVLLLLKKKTYKGDLASFPQGSIYDYYISLDTYEWQLWAESVDEYVYRHGEPFFSILVPTADTTKHRFPKKPKANEKNVVPRGIQ